MEIEAYLVVLSEGSWCNIYPLTSKKRITVGRRGKNRVVLRDDKASREHARIERDGPHWVVRDLDSKNGTYVDGEQIDGTVKLTHGSIIRIGRTELLFTRELTEDPSVHDSVDMASLDELNQFLEDGTTLGLQRAEDTDPGLKRGRDS